jgi:cathepsin L
MRSVIAVALVALFVCIASAATEAEYRQEFTKFMANFNKNYKSAEIRQRYNIFKANYDYINDFNSKNSHMTLAVNQFADLTNVEFKQMYLGFNMSLASTEPSEFEVPATSTPTADCPANSGIGADCDWRQAGAVTGVKNQGQCGSCWAFSTTGSTEGIHFLTTNSLVSLSEQNLIDCSRPEGNQGCQGGLMTQAFQYIIKTGGIDTESYYPYKGVLGTCHYEAADSGATISGFTNVPQDSESALETAAQQQPVSVAIDASHSSFQFYRSGVYYEAACSSTQLDHGVLVVGYGTSGSSDYWLVKNSWGTSWGLSGYIMMSRNRNNNCGIATMASYPSA